MKISHGAWRGPLCNILSHDRALVEQASQDGGEL
jgi:hypothetical protein